MATAGTANDCTVRYKAISGRLSEHFGLKLSSNGNGTVSTCERLFSSAGYIVNKTPCSLEPLTVNLLVCLRN